MSALVAYASSDEDEEIQPAKPAKIARLESNAPQLVVAEAGLDDLKQSRTNTESLRSEARSPRLSVGPAPGPAPKPAAAPPLSTSSTPEPLVLDADGNPLTPFTYERLRSRELTMPPVPNFEIPESPPHSSDIEDRAQLAATTKKFSKFLELKKQGVHFNQRLESSVSLRNPSLLPKLMEFAGISLSESYASTLPIGGELGEWGGVASQWPEQWYVESLLNENERREKKQRANREKVDFVPAAAME